MMENKNYKKDNSPGNLIADGNLKKPPIYYPNRSTNKNWYTMQQNNDTDIQAIVYSSSTTSEEENDDDDDSIEETKATTSTATTCSTAKESSGNESCDKRICENENFLQKYKNADIDDSTCCDDDFTWMHPTEQPTVVQKLKKIEPTVKTSKQLNNDGQNGEKVRRFSRQERNYKSRSTASVREKSKFKDYCPTKYHKNYFETFKYNAPGLWEFPPPPPPPAIQMSELDLHQFNHYQRHTPSNEDLRMHDCRHDCFRYGSFGYALNASQEALCGGNGSGGNCCNRFYIPRCNHYSYWSDSKGKDADERTQRWQHDREGLLNEIKSLNEKIITQSQTIVNLEKNLKEKSEALTNTEDLLQREILLRSSLETHRLKLITAVSELKLQKATLDKEIFEIRASHTNNNVVLPQEQLIEANNFVSPNVNGSFHGSIGNIQKANFLNASTPTTPETSLRRQLASNFNTLPRSALVSSGIANTSWNSNLVNDNNANLRQKNVVFSETLINNSNDITPIQEKLSPGTPKLKSLKNFFGKIRRSNSGNLEDLTSDEFRRGGMRATASPRLGWNSIAKSNKDFKSWNVNDICTWFEEMGLDCYELDVRRWLKDGTTNLIESSPVDIEKELNLKSPLHRKKILLAVSELSGKEKDEVFINAGKLNHAWVMRWLDDAGLPQLKDFFAASKIDGRMLHKLTMDDLSLIPLQSCLHLASLRRGIQVMRDNKWDGDCLVRRSSGDSNINEPVELWTAHRVMEWLRAVDLAEYAPNLRGAGVHGALIKYEPKFNAELLSDLLSIPQSKTLLRRHLATHFKDLLGRDIIQKKREVENTLGYQPLTITSKIKTPKKSQFSLKRRKSTKDVEEWSDYVCPFGIQSDEESTKIGQNSRGISCLSSSS